MTIHDAIKQSLLSLCVACATWWIAIGSTNAQDTATAQAATTPDAKPPRVRFVSSSQTEVLAGPGEDFYPTAILKLGQSVEVHQETADGWLAITPPTGSFSWLPASQGLLLPGGRVVEVTEKSAVSWIGTTLGTAKQYRWQVKLARGQQMAVIGEQTIHDPASGSQALWYKIAPPPGEYRWIQSKATSVEPPATNTSGSSTETLQTIADEVIASSPGMDSQVVQASAEQPLPANTAPKKGRHVPAGAKTARAASHQHEDRWAQWHAVEFKNGSFSFPGVARMLGMEPAHSTPAAAASGDPFDLTANYTRSRSRAGTAASAASADASATDALDQTVSEPAMSDVAAADKSIRQSRGWRDPRQLREARIRGGQVETYLDEDLPYDTALAANESSMEDPDVMDAGFVEDGAIGTGVAPAAASASPRRDRRPPPRAGQADGEAMRGSEQAWYGIDQAPTSHVAGPTSVALASLDELQLELSSMVAGPEYNWNLSPLAERARYFVEHGQDSLQRGQARLLLERIESFAAITAHSSPMRQPAAPGAGGWVTTASHISSNSPTGAVTGAQTDNNAGKFDATGWLVPVHSSGRDMPTHALTNDAGRIIVYVTPAPGVNLTRFESQAIGIYGLRGYLPQLKSNHIQIQRVVRLQ